MIGIRQPALDNEFLARRAPRRRGGVCDDQGIWEFVGHNQRHDCLLWRLQFRCKRILVDDLRCFVGSRTRKLNFTCDELSPLLGIDPANMYKAIRTVGPERCTLSSDAGEPLFPNSVESLRLLRGHMAAFGCTAEEIYTMCTVNPSFIVGLNLTTTQRASAASASRMRSLAAVR
jgi:hypothetical protein